MFLVLLAPHIDNNLLNDVLHYYFFVQQNNCHFSLRATTSESNFIIFTPFYKLIVLKLRPIVLSTIPSIL